MERDSFIATFGGLYENSQWIAASAWDQGLTSVADRVSGLLGVLRQVVDEAGQGPQLGLLRAHPDLAGRLAKAGQLTHASRREQARAGLDQCSETEFKAFQSLNTQYREKFGFPFIMAVTGARRDEILDAFRSRVQNEPEIEFERALSEVHRIASFRLEAIAE